MHPQSLTFEEIASFHENGFLVVRQVVPPDVLTELSRGANDLQKKYEAYRKEKDVYFTSAEAETFDEMLSGSAAANSESEKVLWRVDKLDDKLPEVALLKGLPFVHNAIKALLGDETVQYNESFVTKPPRIGLPVHWHQDPSFKIKKTPDPISTCDVYLDQADEENGCLWVVPGSHKKGIIDVKPLVKKHGFKIPDAIPVRMMPGDVAFHDNGCLHGSMANRTDRQRRIVYLAFQTLGQARAGGAFTGEFIDQRLQAFDLFRQQAFAQK
jgi:ectoine hydroxylase-related dioxygenase (phytanoyl-CoA dioxygenase family)